MRHIQYFPKVCKLNYKIGQRLVGNILDALEKCRAIEVSHIPSFTPRPPTPHGTEESPSRSKVTANWRFLRKQFSMSFSNIRANLTLYSNPFFSMLLGGAYRSGASRICPFSEHVLTFGNQYWMSEFVFKICKLYEIFTILSLCLEN
jgi:hypothetical protein